MRLCLDRCEAEAGLEGLLRWNTGDGTCGGGVAVGADEDTVWRGLLRVGVGVTAERVE